MTGAAQVQRKCVHWKNRDGGQPTKGWCVEVSRDRSAVAAETLCGYSVVLPGPTSKREPTCVECLAIMKTRSAP
jgi:hypothetical protein